MNYMRDAIVTLGFVVAAGLATGYGVIELMHYLNRDARAESKKRSEHLDNVVQLNKDYYAAHENRSYFVRNDSDLDITVENAYFIKSFVDESVFLGKPLTKPLDFTNDDIKKFLTLTGNSTVFGIFGKRDADLPTPSLNSYIWDRTKAPVSFRECKNYVGGDSCIGVVMGDFTKTWSAICTDARGNFRNCGNTNLELGLNDDLFTDSRESICKTLYGTNEFEGQFYLNDELMSSFSKIESLKRQYVIVDNSSKALSNSSGIPFFNYHDAKINLEHNISVRKEIGLTLTLNLQGVRGFVSYSNLMKSGDSSYVSTSGTFFPPNYSPVHATYPISTN